MIINGKILDSEVEYINKKLFEYYSETDNKPNFRLVWSDDQFEKRWVNYDSKGGALNYPEVREVPKYRQLVQGKYILEGLRVVPAFDSSGMIEVVSYEPLYVFENKKGEGLKPTWQVVNFILVNVKLQQENAGKIVKYVDPDADPNESLEIQNKRVNQLVEDLFGNETDMMDAVRYGEGIIVPSNRLVEPNLTGVK